MPADARRRRVTAVCIAVVPILVSALRFGQRWVAAGDVAVLAARATDVGTRATPLLGMPSTASGTDGTLVHHPGPLELWLIGIARHVNDASITPFVVIVAVNILSAAAIVWWSRRLGPPAMAWAALLAVGLVTWSLRGEILVSPFNPYAALLPFAAYLVAAAASTMRERGATIGAIVAGSWAAQAHLAYVLPTVAVAIALVALRWHAHRHDPGRRVRIADAATVAAVAALLWSGPILEAMIHGGGNVLALLDGDESPRLGVGTATDVMVNATAPLPVFARGDADPFLFLAPPSAAARLMATLFLAAVVAVAWRRRGQPTGTMALLGLAGLLGGFVTLVALPDLTFNSLALHNYLWLWPIEALLWVVVATEAAVAVRRWLGPGVRRGATWALVGVAVCVAAAACLPPVRPDADWERTGTRRTVDAVLPVLDRDEVYAVEVDGDFGVFAVQVGLAHELERRGIEVRVPPHLEPAFGRRGDDPAGHEILVRSVEDPLRPPPAGLEPVAVVGVPEHGHLAIYVRDVQG